MIVEGAPETESKHLWFNGWLLVPFYCSAFWEMCPLLSVLLFPLFHSNCHSFNILYSVTELFKLWSYQVSKN